MWASIKAAKVRTVLQNHRKIDLIVNQIEVIFGPVAGLHRIIANVGVLLEKAIAAFVADFPRFAALTPSLELDNFSLLLTDCMIVTIAVIARALNFKER